jgi:PTS system nitrogen regulatory IIA component
MRDMILFDLESDNRDEALKEMVGYLKRKHKVFKEKELLDKLKKREELGSTAIGNGVAIPHCKSKAIKESVILLAIAREGIHFDAMDGKPAHLFFLVVSPPENPSLNLQILAAIAHLVRKSKDLIRKIKQASNIGEIMDIISEEEEKLNESS